MMYVRPCVAEDFPALEQLAYDSPVGLTSLSEDSEKLMTRLQNSVNSFAATVTEPGDQEYLFALVDADTQAVVGVSGLVARTGLHEPYFNFRREQHYIFSQTMNSSVFYLA